MGVTGLWSLLEPVGKPIPLESLENKILAIDVSIWLNQAVKGFRDRSGNAVANAHLLGLFHRICKLLFYRIRPIFVFDGKAPALKRETLARRRHRKNAAKDKSDAARIKLLENYVKRQAVATKLKRQTHALDNVLKSGQAGLSKLLNDRSKTNEKDLFELPARNQEFVESSSSDEEGNEVKYAALSMLETGGLDIHSLDVESAYFKSLPMEVQYEVLTEIKERRKQNSWHKMSEMPSNAEGFSGFQMERLRKRKTAQKTLESVGKTLGDESSADLDANLFVGDREGLKKVKKETRKIASSGGFSVYVTGLKPKEVEQKEDLELCKLMHPKLEEKRELKSSSDEESDESESSSDNKELAALKMAADADMSQDEILALIRSTATKPKKDIKGGVDTSLSDADDEIEILEPSTVSAVSTLRSGGRLRSVSTEQPLPTTSNHKNLQEKDGPRSPPTASPRIPTAGDSEAGDVLTIEVKTSANVEVMSDSGSESDEDMFADVFADGSKTQALDSILASAASAPKTESDQPSVNKKPQQPTNVEHPDAKIVESVTQFDYTDDVFAQISKKVRKFSETEKEAKFSGRTKEAADVVEPQVAAEDNKSGEVNKDIAASMKDSDHLWLKLASKWAYDSPRAKSDGEEIPTPSDNPSTSSSGAQRSSDVREPPGLIKDTRPELLDFDHESEKLLREMRQKEKEDRLLKIKQINEDNVRRDREENSQIAESEPALDPSDSNVLDNLGVTVVQQSSLEKEVMREQGWEEEKASVKDTTKKANESEVVYGDSVPGFVRSKHGPEVHDVSAPPSGEDLQVLEHAVEKLEADNTGIEGDEVSALTEAELVALQENLAKEQESLIAERGKEERLAASISDQMYAECQELLRLFGIPWVVSPSEAEAQCAFLDEAGLSHGTITDDSDIWVFGGKTVYKNFFEREKYCETFSVAEIAKHFGLTREKMILLAMLTGSDYTEGIENVGPVTAMEILSEFSGDGMSPLESLKVWWTENLKETKMPGNQARAKLKKLHFPNSFPNRQVFHAYVQPSVDRSDEKFSWAIPNFVAVRDFATEKFGWSKVKIDELVKPVIKKMSGPYQGRIDNFFLSERNVLPKKGNLQYSKRIQSALEKVKGSPKKDGPAASAATSKEPQPKKAPKKPVKKSIHTQAKKDEEQRDGSTVDTAIKKTKETGGSATVVKELQSEAAQKLEARKRAAEIFKQSLAEKKSKKNRANEIKRKVLASHNLSESESD